MENRYLFRGKRIDNGEWVEGYLSYPFCTKKGNESLHNGNYFVVKWNAPCARFDIVLNNSHNIPIGKWEPMICDLETNDFKEYRKSVDYEVIGNIFDNPELLEV